ncbi:hypothetical protein AB3S75_010181 [Citrus x aurantiifolia]
MVHSAILKGNARNRNSLHHHHHLLVRIIQLGLREPFLHLEESWRFVFFGCCLILNKVANSEFSWKRLLFIFSNCYFKENRGSC